MSDIATVIAAAKASAAGLAPEASQAVVAAAPVNSVVPFQPAKAIGLDDLMTGSISVSAWLKLKPYGLIVGTDPELRESIDDVIVDMSAVQYGFGVRFGNPAQYRTTFDGVNDSKGGLWAQTLSQAKMVDVTASQYRTAVIPFATTADVKNKKGEIVVEAGKKIGLTLPVTGWAVWADFVRDLGDKGINPHNAKVKMNLGFVFSKNAKGEWGLPKFSNVVEIKPEATAVAA